MTTLYFHVFIQDHFASSYPDQFHTPRYEFKYMYKAYKIHSKTKKGLIDKGKDTPRRPCRCRCRFFGTAIHPSIPGNPRFGVWVGRGKRGYHRREKRKKCCLASPGFVWTGPGRSCGDVVCKDDAIGIDSCVVLCGSCVPEQDWLFRPPGIMIGP